MRRAQSLMLLLVFAACASSNATNETSATREALCVASPYPWDVIGISIFGDSNATGYVYPGDPSTTLSTLPAGNIALRDPTGVYAPGGASLEIVPYVEPMRPTRAGSYIPYPNNLAPGCEPPSAYAVNHLRAIWQSRGQRPPVFGVTNVAIGGASLVHLTKGGDLRSYSAALDEVSAFTRLLAAQGQTYGVGFVLLTHGKADAKNASYGDQLVAFYDALDADVQAITHQAQHVILLGSQEATVSGGLTGSPIGLLAASHARPGRIVLSGPRYPFATWLRDAPGYHANHYTAEGYQRIGAIYAQALDALLQGNAWQPIEPLDAQHNATTIRVRYAIPVPPLAWSTTILDPWAGTHHALTHGKGFEVRDASGAFVFINGVTIEPPDVVVIALARDPGHNANVAYAVTGTSGQLCDSETDETPEGYSLTHCAVSSTTVVP